MISRIAESCFWLGRYVERAECTARLLWTTTLGSDGELTLWERWQPILTVTGEMPAFQARFGEEAVNDRDTVLEYLTWDDDCPVSIVRSWGAVRENARGIRETISREMWESVNRMWLWLTTGAGRAMFDDDPTEFFRHIREAGQLIRGTALGTLLDDEPLWFMSLGMYLERAGQTARILDVKYHLIGPTSREKNDGVKEMAIWVQLLLACGAYENFFKQRKTTIRGYRVAEVLVGDPKLPRSIVYSLNAAVQQLMEIANETGRPELPGRTGIVDLLERARVMASAEELWGKGMHVYMTSVIAGVAAVGQSLYTEVFQPTSNQSQVQ
jgi:uncharacterized alpha-E superfamily protein